MYNIEANNELVEPRQDIPPELAKTLPEFKVAKKNEGPSTLKVPGAKKLEIWWGPLVLKISSEVRCCAQFFTNDVNEVQASKGPKIPGQMDPNSNSFMGMAKAIPGDISVLRASTKIKFEDGKDVSVADGIYNHHTAFTSMTKKMPKPWECASTSEAKEALADASTVTAVAEEGGISNYAGIDGTFNSGYYVEKDPKILYSGELINYTNQTKTVYIVTDFDYVEGRPAGRMDTGIVVLSVTQCTPGSTPMLRPPPGQNKYNYQSNVFKVTQDGYLLMRRGHLHDGGTNIIMKVNGKEMNGTL